MEPAEFTFICIDNAVFWEDPFHRAQQDAIKFYCETLFKCNPDNAVCLFLMTSWKVWVGPTRDLQEISRRLEHVPWFGGMQSSYALSVAAATLDLVPSHMKRRLIMFVASPLDDVRAGHQTNPVLCGRVLKARGVALHVFNFFLSKSKTSGYRYMRNYLDILVTTVNNNDNSRLEDVDKSNIREKLSNSILKENLHYLSKTTRNEMNRAAAGVRDIELSDFSLINKLLGFCNPDVRVLSSPPVKQTDVSITSMKLSGEKTEEDVSVKQGLELSCNEKNKAATQGISNECVKPKLLKETAKQMCKLSVNEKNQAAAENGKHSPPCAEKNVSVKRGLQQPWHKAYRRMMLNDF